VTFYVFDDADPIVAAYRGIFPALFKDGAEMPPTLRAHVRYPELLLKMQAMVYGLYHMTDPEVFYNREDLWTVASDVAATNSGERATQPMEPNFVLMKLPGETSMEFVEILPFTPANRNNLIGWIAGRSDESHYGDAIVYDFPRTRLVDGPLQIEARIDQNAQLSGQLSLWNQQGSRVRRGALLVIIGRLTFSAAPNTVTAIERETSAIFVGEPTGSRPNFIGERIDFELPYSKVRANAADLYWQTSWPTDYRTWTAPDIYAPPTFEAFRRNQDPALDAILAIREYVPGW